MQKICIVTGSRAEYGLLFWLMKAIQADPQLKLQVVVCCNHLTQQHQYSFNEIIQDGFEIDAKIDMLLASNSAVAITKSSGLGLIGFADAFERLKPNMVIVLGDRFETFAACQAAYLAGIKIAHLHGGELTFGAYDDGFRHCMTKLSTLHFVSNEAYRQRVIQLGEHPERVHCVGAIALDGIRNQSYLSLDELEKNLNISFLSRKFIVTLHPETSSQFNEVDYDSFFRALDALDDDISIIFTIGSADVKSQVIHEKVDAFVSKNQNAYKFLNLGQQRYFSLVKHSDLVLGNSSSGILEVPYLGVPTIDIGARQSGRIRPQSVIHCEFDTSQIISAINQALVPKFKNIFKTMDYPYGTEEVSSSILMHLKHALEYPLIDKTFYDLMLNDTLLETVT